MDEDLDPNPTCAWARPNWRVRALSARLRALGEMTIPYPSIAKLGTRIRLLARVE